jgi:hypothetical protein
MATYQAIAVTGGAILNLLEGARPRPEFDNAQFALFQPADFARNTPPMREGVSLLLYRVDVNGATRNQPLRQTADGRFVRPGLPLDLHYLLTAWAETAQKQQRLLGWAMQSIDDHAILPSALLNHSGPEPDVFRPEETVELVFETLSVQDLAYAWQFSQANQQPSACLLARVVGLEPTRAQETGPPVQVRRFDLGRPDES